MHAKRLSPTERDQLRRQVAPRRDYLGRRVARMEALGFPETDRVRVAAARARDAVEGILTALDSVEPPAPFLAHYGPSEPIPRREGVPDAGTAHLPWVGKRKAGRR